jgi:competence protein ComFB
MDFRKNYDFSLLVNEVEQLAIEELGSQLSEEKNSGVCVCQDCVLDMAAYALNHLRPVYRVSLLGTLYAHSLGEGSFKEELKKNVAEAIQKIKDNPSHD